MKRLVGFLLLIAAGGCGDNKGGGNCQPQFATVCPDGHLYWQDSCGIRGERIKTCECGCDDAGQACRTPCECQPMCTGRCCGDNGCGGVCYDNCTGEFVCNPATCRCESPTCTPKTCSELGKECGTHSDGCGSVLDCGTCPNGTCNAEGRCVCSEGEKKCSGESFQVCQAGSFVEVEKCSSPRFCLIPLGCVWCDPTAERVCYQDDVHACNPDGTIGSLIETCWTEACVDGNCGNPACPPETMYIYVVDDTYRLLSFNPATGGDPFHLIGNLNCPASSSWPDWGGGDPATPFSMSVDRSGRAWVLYTSGEIFWVSTTDASCQLSPYSKGQAGYKLFGMGFVSDAAGSESEKLYISGGNVDAQIMGNMGYIDPNTLAVATLGPCPQAEYSPELTGTGKGEWYAYFPGVNNSFVARLSKQNGSIEQQWPVPALGATVRAWAFAHWGGKFYIFVTTSSGSYRSRVLRFNPQTGQTETFMDNLPYIIVGAGVSTCAPYR